MIMPLDSLQHDHAILTESLAARRAVTAVTLPVGLGTVYSLIPRQRALGEITGG